MPLWVYIGCVLLACVLVWLWDGERRIRRPYDNLPTFLTLPFIGNLYKVRGDGRVVLRMLDQISNICEKTSTSPFVFWFGRLPIFVADDPDDVKAINNTFVEKPFFYNFASAWLGNGLVTAPGCIWKQSIKKLSGTFTAPVVDGFLGTFNAQAQKLVQNLKTEVGKEPFDIAHKYLAYTTLETICQTALGVPQLSDDIATRKHYEAFNRVLELLITRAFNIFMYPDFIYNCTSARKEYLKCVDILHNASMTVLKKKQVERKEAIETQNNNITQKSKTIEPRFRPFVDILLDLSESDPSFTEQQIKSELDTIILAGQETVATALFFLLLVIGCKPKIQNKMYAELKSIFGDSNRPVTKEDLSQMKYCEAVICETLRLYPPVPAVMRHADKDLQLNSCRIPEGSSCVVNIWGAGRSERIWGPDAKVYRPERWLADEPPGSPAAFLSFSYGRRACIGKKYAVTIIKTVLCHCLRELEFISEADKMELKMDVALRPISGHLIQVRLRNK